MKEMVYEDLHAHHGSRLVKLTAALVAATTSEVLSSPFWLVDWLVMGAPGQCYCFITTQTFPVQDFTEYRYKANRACRERSMCPCTSCVR